MLLCINLVLGFRIILMEDAHCCFELKEPVMEEQEAYFCFAHLTLSQILSFFGSM